MKAEKPMPIIMSKIVGKRNLLTKLKFFILDSPG